MPDIYTPLRCGCRLVIIPEVYFVVPAKLVNYIVEKKIDTLIWVPSALMALTNKNYLSLADIQNLRLVMFCGEVMPNKHLNIWRKRYPNTLFVNLYGPTEAAYACTYYIVDRVFNDDEMLPIGYPCDNTDIIVLDGNNNRIVETNVEGELCIRGSCLASGYYNESVKTREVFVDNPLNPYYDNKIYRTGDIVKYNEHGELEYIGRKDFQIKHMGYRIELGEVEMAAYSIKDISQCCAIYDGTEKEIDLYCTVESGIEKKEIYKSLKKKIPKYMLPHNIYILESLPLNPNGKIDRGALKDRQKRIE